MFNEATETQAAKQPELNNDKLDAVVGGSTYSGYSREDWALILEEMEKQRKK